MPGAAAERFDFFLSRRGSVAATAQEVDDVLTAAGYKVFVQDYDIPLGASFVGAMHDGIKNARGLIILFSGDYERSPYTRKEFTSFEAERLQDERERHIVVLRCEDAPLRGLLADVVYQDLVGVADPDERKRRILAAAERRSSAERPQKRRGRTFVGVPPRIAGFTGRADELDRLDAILIQKRPAAVTQVGRAAVQGMGGVGKTSLAVEYANRFRNLYDGVWWCQAETRTSLTTGLAALVVELEVSSPEEADIDKAAQAALRALAGQGDIWLLVYDNAPSPEEITDLLPAAGARVLITSRFSDWGGWADEVSLDVLPLGEAIVLLHSRSGRGDEAGARTLAEVLGRLPLALDHAAAFCKRTGMSFADYAANASDLIAAAPRGAAYPRSAAATFDLAIDEAVAQCPTAEDLMAFLAFCAPERIPLILVEGAIDEGTEQMAALAALAELSLIKHDPFEDDTLAVTVHRLVQAAARTRSEAKRAAQNAHARLIARLVAIYPKDGNDNPASWPRCAQLTPHLRASCETEMEAAADAERAELLGRAGGYFQGRGVYSQALPLLERALAISETALGPEHLDTARWLNNLGALLQEQGNLAGARPLLERALAITEKTYTLYPLETATSLSSLGLLLLAQGDLSEARPLLEDALAITAFTLGSEHPHTANALNNLAGLLQTQNDLAGARPLFERALLIQENTLGPEDPATASGLNNLAGLLYTLGDLAAARPLFERALTIQEKTLGPEHPDTAKGLNSLASLLQAQGDLAVARPLFERALTIQEKTFGSEHPHTVNGLNSLAGLLYTLGDLAGARPLVERALAIREKTLGPEHPDTAQSVNHLGGLLQAQSDLAGARPLFERALAIRENTLGPEHLDTAESLNNLACLLQAQSDLAGARPLFERALLIREKAFGPEHPGTAESLNNLAGLLQAQGDFPGARPLFERALAIREKALGPEHPLTATSLNSLAFLLYTLRDLAGARPLLERALLIRENTLGPEHLDTAESLNNLACLLQAQYDLAGARPLFERALAIREKALGPEHPATALVRHNLARSPSLRGFWSWLSNKITGRGRAM
jgi:tetratricopeptide (TPR) repeat protein